MKNKLKIGNRYIGENEPAYIIAEIGLNHQGDFKLAKKLIDAAKAAGADCAKFQKRNLKKLYKKDVLENYQDEEQGGQYILKHTINSELSKKQMSALQKYCQKKEIDFMCTPWDEESLEFIASLDVPAFKIGSPDMVNLPLIQKVLSYKKPLIISTGMSFYSEIEQVVQFLNDFNAEYVLLHCNSTYPAPFEDINLQFLHKLKNLSSNLIGYSGHEKGIAVSISAVALGAKVIERHITLDRNMPGPDHKASLEPDKFKAMITSIRQVETALGEPVRYMSRGEYLNRQALSKSLVAAKDLKAGKILNYDDIDIKGPGKGTSPLKLTYFIGKTLKNNRKKDDYILESDAGIRASKIVNEKVSLNHHWGVVARLSDIDTLLWINSDFIEIHLTDSDVNKPIIYKNKIKNKELVIHCPEYNGELLLDLSHLDEKIRTSSVKFFNKSLQHARKLKKIFHKKASDKIKVVIHPGGFALEAPLLDKKAKLYKQLHKSLKELNGEGFELLVENMPPRPWFFGGQWYSSIFMDADEIVEFSKRTGFGIVFDTSHAALYCNYYKKNFEEFTKKILPVTKYLHVADAAKTNGEGLPIGDGNIDFIPLLKRVEKTKLWILPEVWQGHKFNGEGFLVAITKLKNLCPQL